MANNMETDIKGLSDKMMNVYSDIMSISKANVTPLTKRFLEMAAENARKVKTCLDESIKY